MTSDGSKPRSAPTKAGVKLFVPGRLCLFGEHSDWAAEFGLHDGFCLVIGTDQGLVAEVEPSDDFIVETLVPDVRGRPSGRTRRMSCEWNSRMLREAANDDDEFFRYCAGTAHEMLSRPGVSGGIDIRIRSMDLPLRKGVSSSAAVCILVAKAFDLVYRLGMFPHELMDVAYRGERLTGSQCGRMDQACIYGKTPVLLTFAKASDVRIEPVFPADRIDMFFVDLAGRKDTVRILDDLRNAYPKSKTLQNALGGANELLVRRAYHALWQGDAQELGALMCEAQAMFDEQIAPHSHQLTSPLLHEVLSMTELAGHIWGAKGVGSQGDGTAQFVARSPSDRKSAISLIEEKYPSMQCFPLTVTAQSPNND